MVKVSINQLTKSGRRIWEGELGAVPRVGEFVDFTKDVFPLALRGEVRAVTYTPEEIIVDLEARTREE